jgi:hypothetical protein
LYTLTVRMPGGSCIISIEMVTSVYDGQWHNTPVTDLIGCVLSHNSAEIYNHEIF